MADLLGGPEGEPAGAAGRAEPAFTVSTTARPDGRQVIEVLATGEGDHTFTIRGANIRFEDATRTVRLPAGGQGRVTWIGTVGSANAPWVAVVVPDGDVDRRREVVGDT
jgi:hypothetical protein